MTKSEDVAWEEHHRGPSLGEPEPFVAEMIALMPRGIALDVAAGRGRNTLALARAGFKAVAIDSSPTAIRMLAAAARAESLPVLPVVADVAAFPIGEQSVDVVINVNFLDRALIPRLKDALRIGGVLLFDTFLIDQAAIGPPRNPDYLLDHYELRDLLGDMELVRYREGITVYPEGARAWRASALALRRN
jgi:tellurite methyltransferase